MNVCIHTYIYICIYVYIYIFTYIYICIYMYVYTYMYLNIYIYICTFMYAHTHIYIFIHMHSSFRSCSVRISKKQQISDYENPSSAVALWNPSKFRTYKNTHTYSYTCTLVSEVVLFVSLTKRRCQDSILFPLFVALWRLPKSGQKYKVN